MSEQENIESQLQSEIQFLKSLILSQQDQIQNLMILVHETNSTTQRLTSSLDNLTQKPSPIAFSDTDQRHLMDEEDSEDYDMSEFEEVLSILVGEEDSPVGPDAEDLEMMGIVIPDEW